MALGLLILDCMVPKTNRVGQPRGFVLQIISKVKGERRLSASGGFWIAACEKALTGGSVSIGRKGFRFHAVGRADDHGTVHDRVGSGVNGGLNLSGHNLRISTVGHERHIPLFETDAAGDAAGQRAVQMGVHSVIQGEIHAPEQRSGGDFGA